MFPYKKNSHYYYFPQNIISSKELGHAFQRPAASNMHSGMMHTQLDCDMEEVLEISPEWNNCWSPNRKKNLLACDTNCSKPLSFGGTQLNFVGIKYRLRATYIMAR